MSEIAERGIYLTAPDGRVIVELRLDSNLRAHQRWHRPWQPHQDVHPDRRFQVPVSCDPSNPSKLCQG